MSDSIETTAAILTRLFKAPDALMGQDWLDSVASGWTPASLQSLVVTTGTLSASKTKELYGHYRTKTQMRGISGPYWHKEQGDKVKKELARLNVDVLGRDERLKLLRTDAVGGVLVVTTVIEPDGTTSPPFITILAAPSVATFVPPVSENGVLYNDVWDTMVLARFLPELDLEVAHSPFMGAQEGFSRADVLQPGMFQFLQDAQPLFIPAGEDLCESLDCGGERHLRAIFLPEVCNLPVGMRWPTDIGLKDFKRSIQGALGPVGQVFLQMLTDLDKPLTAWFKAVETVPARFSLASCPFLEFYDQNYPGIDNGEWPDTIVDTEGFSPLLDMMNGHLWRLWCDRMLTKETKLNREYLNIYLKIGESVITEMTYLGAKIPGRFCPNFAHHFKVTNGWPTDTATTKFLREFHHRPLLSYQALQHDPMEVDLNQPQLALGALRTREELMSENHRSKTPKFSEVPPKTPTRKEVIDMTGRKPTKTGNYGLKIPSPSIKPFTPDQMAIRKPTPMESAPPTQRRLEDDLHASVKPLVPVGGGSFNPITATVYTTDGRGVATDAFLNVCRLLAHHATSRQLLVGRDILPQEALIYVREPCGLFRREILAPLQKLGPTSGFMPSFLSFTEAMLRPAQIYLSGVYDPHFFSGAFLHAFLSVESWMVTDHMLPENVPSSTFHVYKLISCIQKYAGHKLLIPTLGLSLLEAKQVGILTYYLFAMMDLTDGSFSDKKFESSILGNRLKVWSLLPDSPNIHGLWNKAPLQATYHWFASLQSLLQIEQNWIKRLRYHPEKGFFHARDVDGQRYLLLDNQVPSNIPGRTDSLIEALRQFDTQFETRWFCGSFLDAIWTTPIPLGHHVIVEEPPSQIRQYNEITNHDEGVPTKRKKLGGKKQREYDYISSTPLMEMVIPLPAATRSVTMALIKRIAVPIQFPRLPASNGTLQTICLNSVLPAPYNCCLLRLCGDKKATPRAPRLHIDLSKEPWRSKPEAYWTPMVEFLQMEPVIPHMKPSAALKRATPNTKWQ